MSDTPRTDAVWTEYWNEFPTPENTATTNQRIFFDMKLKQLEQELSTAQSAAISNKSLATAISRYTVHRATCIRTAHKCTCGLTNLLKQLEST